MANQYKEIMELCEGLNEEPLFFVVGYPDGDRGFHNDEIPPDVPGEEDDWSNYQRDKWNVTPSLWKKVHNANVLKMLDYEYEGGFGGCNAHAVYVWTENWVILMAQYDGSEWHLAVPRNPAAILPQKPGGG